MPTASPPYILVERDPRGVMELRLNRPESFNALSGAMIEALQAQLDTIAHDPQVRAVVISAKGRAFCAGHDLKDIAATAEVAFYQALFEQCGKMMLSIAKLPVPVIAKVQGLATLVNAVSVNDSAEALNAEVERLLASILDKPSAALTWGKELVYRQQGLSLEAAYKLAAHTMAMNMMDEAAQEGVRAFTEKRQPSWKLAAHIKEEGA
jgi:enoyl-CoA hydratase/carnithine racemase